MARPRKAKVKQAVKVEEAEKAIPTKYIPEPKIGEPTIGVEPEFVTRVGLGNLTVVETKKEPYKP